MKETNHSRKYRQEIMELEKQLKNKESTITQLQEKLNNDQEILHDLIEERQILNQQIQDHQINQAHEKIIEYQKLEDDHHKTVHRVQVTKQQLDNARAKIEELENITEDLANRSFLDYLLRRYPQSYQAYKPK